jgi:hypothetical protein
MASLGSALLGLSTMTGALINLYGPRSTGKSVMQTVAASFWGATRSAYMQHGEDTTKSNASYAGALGSLPLIIDEITLMKEQDMSEFAYMVAMGRPKHANNSDGTPRNVPRGWRLTAFTSANRQIRDVVSSSTEHTDVDAAKQARILEMYCRALSSGQGNRHGDDDGAGPQELWARRESTGLGTSWPTRLEAARPARSRSASPCASAPQSATVTSVPPSRAYLLACEELRDLGLWPCSAGRG